MWKGESIQVPDEGWGRVAFSDALEGHWGSGLEGLLGELEQEEGHRICKKMKIFTKLFLNINYIQDIQKWWSIPRSLGAVQKWRHFGFT